MLGAFFAVAATTSFTVYPAFLERHAVIEAVTDKGLVLELIVRCPDGTGIISFDKTLEVYCAADLTCSHSIRSAVRRTCR